MQSIKKILFVIFSLFIVQPSMAEDFKNSVSSSQPVSIGATYTIHSTVLDQNRRITIRLPDVYSTRSRDTFPLIVMVDGGPSQDFPHIAGLLQYADLNHTLLPVILVGVETIDRQYEMTPPAQDPRYDELFERRGGAAQFRAYIREDVLPWIETNYRISDDRTLIGESLGGLFVIDTLLSEPDLFKKYAAISPSLWWDDLAIAKSAKQSLGSLKRGDRKLYVTMGNEGWKMQEGLDVLLESLRDISPRKLSWIYTDRRNSEEHGSIYNPSALDAFRHFYTAPFRVGATRSTFYMFEGGIAPKISRRADRSLRRTCSAKTAHRTTFEEINADPVEWNSVCVLVKTGPAATETNIR